MADLPPQSEGPDSQLAPIPWNNRIQLWMRSKAEKQSALLTRRAEIARQNPEEAAKAYDAARKSMFGDLGSNVDTGCQECLLRAKAASRKARKDLTDRALASGCSTCKESAQRLRSDMDEVETMRCAKQVYLAEDPNPNTPAELKRPPIGFREPSKDELAELGLTEDMLRPEGSSFRARVYIKDPEVWAPPNPPDPKAIVAFRGSTPELEDWENNFMQGADSDPGFLNPKTKAVNEAYYKRAVEIGKAVGRNSKSVQFTGHSLGGGLASAAQGGSGGAQGNPASTYNSAGLNSSTVAKYAGKDAAANKDKINAIRVEGEVLTKSQESGLSGMFAPSAVGKKRNLKPALTKQQYLDGQGKFDRQAAQQMGEDFDEDDAYSTQLHGMDEVIAAMEAQKQADQAALEDCAARDHGLIHRIYVGTPYYV